MSFHHFIDCLHNILIHFSTNSRCLKNSYLNDLVLISHEKVKKQTQTISIVTKSCLLLFVLPSWSHMPMICRWLDACQLQNSVEIALPWTKFWLLPAAIKDIIIIIIIIYIYNIYIIYIYIFIYIYIYISIYQKTHF